MGLNGSEVSRVWRYWKAVSKAVTQGSPAGRADPLPSDFASNKLHYRICHTVEKQYREHLCFLTQWEVLDLKPVASPTQLFAL